MPSEINIETLQERDPRESAVAFAAYVGYRDLGPQRSIDKAWRAAKNISDASKRAPRHWFAWSTQYRWERRALAWDEHRDRVALQAEQTRWQELAERRKEQEFQFQDIVERRVKRLIAMLEKFENVPPTTVTRIEKKDGSIITTVNGLNASAYAQLNKELLNTAAQATLGPHPQQNQPQPEALPELVVTVTPEATEALARLPDHFVERNSPSVVNVGDRTWQK